MKMYDNSEAVLARGTDRNLFANFYSRQLSLMSAAEPQ